MNASCLPVMYSTCLSFIWRVISLFKYSALLVTQLSRAYLVCEMMHIIVIDISSRTFFFLFTFRALSVVLSLARSPSFSDRLAVLRTMKDRRLRRGGVLVFAPLHVLRPLYATPFLCPFVTSPLSPCIHIRVSCMFEFGSGDAAPLDFHDIQTLKYCQRSRFGLFESPTLHQISIRHFYFISYIYSIVRSSVVCCVSSRVLHPCFYAVLVGAPESAP